MGFTLNLLAPGGSHWLVNIGSANGLVLSGNKPLPEPVLTQIYVSYGATSLQCVNASVIFINTLSNGLLCVSTHYALPKPVLNNILEP